MLHSVTNGAGQGAVIGAVGGLLLWLVVKVFKLEGYFGGRKLPPAPSNSVMPPQTTNTWSGDGVYPPQPVLGDAPTPPAPTQTALIAVMWGLTALISLSFVIAHITSVLLIFLDIPAIVIAIILLIKRNAVNRWNGGAKLALEALAFVVAFSFAVRQVRLTPGMPPAAAAPTMPGQIAPPPNFRPTSRNANAAALQRSPHAFAADGTVRTTMRTQRKNVITCRCQNLIK